MEKPTEKFWLGDGREKVEPVTQYQIGGRPGAVTRGQARMLIDSFLAHGLSTHSSARATLWVIIGYCEISGRPYRLEAYPDGAVVIPLQRQGE